MVAVLIAVSACSGAQESAAPATARATDAVQSSPLAKRAEATNGMVAAAHPLAAQAGVDMLKQGGNAIDAAVATAFVLNVVEPMMAGIGGGGSMTIWRADAATADFVEFYASAGADPDYELEQIPDSVRSRERMVAVPGAVDGLLSAHERYGTLPRETILQPAIQAARDGFPVHTLFARVIAEYEDRLTYDPEAAAVFYPDGEPLQAGDLLVQPALAGTLQRIAQQGRRGFYQGPVAQNAIEKLQAGGSPLTLDDFRNYESRWRKPLCGQYKGYTVLAATPPLDGVEVLQTLELLEPYDLPSMGLPANDPDVLSHVVDAIRIARTDRAQWIGDPDDTGVPAVGIASPAFANERRVLMERATVPDSMTAGDPWDEEQAAQPTAACQRLGAYPPTTLPKPDVSTVTDGEDPEESETTHLSVVDADGNAVSLTYTMGLYFGSAVYSDGAFYNSAALNFDDDVVANQRAPYRTPRSTTTPTILLDGDAVRLVVGSPGSGRIPPAIVHMILYTLDYGLDPATSIRMPRVYPFTTEPTVRVEDGLDAHALARLRERGYQLEVYPPFDPYFGGVHMILVDEQGRKIGAADPRRNGVAIGY
jgi:gamma-glutamyltranspeptidase/glutathione hydrolase